MQLHLKIQNIVGFRFAVIYLNIKIYLQMKVVFEDENSVFSNMGFLFIRAGAHFVGSLVYPVKVNSICSESGVVVETAFLTLLDCPKAVPAEFVFPVLLIQIIPDHLPVTVMPDTKYDPQLDHS